MDFLSLILSFFFLFFIFYMSTEIYKTLKKAIKKEEIKKRIVVHQNLDNYINDRNLDISEFASSIGTTENTVNAVINGSYTPSLYLALLMAYRLDCKIEDLFYLSVESVLCEK